MLFYINAGKDTIFVSERFLSLIFMLGKISRGFTVKSLLVNGNCQSNFFSEF